MDPVETARRPSVKLHLALLAALGLYCLLFVQIRARTSANVSNLPASERTGLFLPMLVLGILQFGVLSVMARKRLRSTLGQPAARARLYFLLRAVSAEAIALFGLLIGLKGAPVREAAALFALALAAMLSCFPTREAWENALRAAQTPGS